MGNLTLWEIESSLMGLIEIREDPNSSEEEKAVADSEIQKYVEAEIKKVDRIRNFLRHCDLMADAAKFEADAMRRRGQQWEERGRRLKELCITAMNARGQKRLEGQSGTLRIQAAGGKRALKITRDDLVPNQYRVATIVANYSMARTLPLEDICASGGSVKWSSDTEAIRKAMDTPCQSCKGSGGSITMSTIGTFIKQDPCEDCRGTGYTVVAGCCLEPRKESLRVG